MNLNVPFSFKYQIEIERGGKRNRIENINNFNILIPKYRNIPFISCNNKSYAEKIMSEEIQKEIAELVTKIGTTYAIKFYEDSILLIIFYAKWSTNFSRMFFKRKNVQNIFGVIDEVTEKLLTIATKIENSGFCE